MSGACERERAFRSCRDSPRIAPRSAHGYPCPLLTSGRVVRQATMLRTDHARLGGRSPNLRTGSPLARFAFAFKTLTPWATLAGRPAIQPHFPQSGAPRSVNGMRSGHAPPLFPSRSSLPDRGRAGNPRQRSTELRHLAPRRVPHRRQFRSETRNTSWFVTAEPPPENESDEQIPCHPEGRGISFRRARTPRDEISRALEMTR
jgi:hypothetical protein